MVNEIREAMIIAAVDAAGAEGILDVRDSRIDDQAAKKIHKQLVSRRCEVRVFRLNNNHIGASGLKSLQVHLTANCVREIYLGSNEFGPESAQTWHDILAKKQLEILDLSYSKIGSKGVVQLAHGLKKNDSLKTLYLSSSSFRELQGFISDDMLDALKELSEALKTHEKIEILHLESNNLGPGGIGELTPALQMNASIVELNLQGNELGSPGAEKLAGALEENTAVVKLNLAMNEIRARGVRALANMLAKNKTLEVLNLERNRVDKEAAEALGEMLSRDEAPESALRVLNLADNEIQDDGAVALAGMIENNENLEELSLEANSIGSKGMVAIAGALIENSSLLNINLAWNAGGTQGALRMADAIGQNSTLEVVLLHGNQMSSEGVSALAESLPSNNSLTHLGLWSNAAGMHGACMMADALAINTSLEYLDLRENGIKGEGAQSLARAINKNTTLVELRLEGNVGIRLADSIFLFACGGNRVKLDLSTNDQRAQVAIAQGNGFRENDVEPEMVPEEVLLMDSPAYANDTAQYFADLQKGEIGQISYLKVLVVGSSEAGKTSLVRSLIECSASSAGSTSSGGNREVAEGPTLGVETYRLPRHGESSSSSSNGDSDGSQPGRVDLFDFGSDAEHFLTHARFLANRSLVVLVVDLTLYGNANDEPTEHEAQVFEETVGRWVRAMQVQLQRSRLMIVGSKGDALGGQEASARMENVLDYLEDMMDILNADARRDFALGMSGTFIELSLTPDSAFVVSSMDPLFVDGVKSLAESLGMMASDASLGLSLQVPRSYAALREYVEAKASEGIDVLDFEEVRSDLGFDDNEYGFEVALKLLHVLGLLQWCDFSAFASSSDPSRARIRHTIFTRPSFVLEALWSLCEGSSEKGTILTPDDVHAALDQYRVIYESVLDEFSLPDGRKWADVPARERSLYLDLLCELDILAEVVDKDAVDHSQRVFRVPILFRLDAAAAAVVPDAAVLRRSVREEQDSRSLYRNNESTGRGRRLSLSPFATSRMHSLHWHYEFPIAFPEGFFARLVSKLHPIMSIGEVNDHYVHGFIRFIEKGGDNGTPGDRRSATRGASDAVGLTARRSRHEPVYVTVFSARDSDARGRMSVRAMTMTPQRGGKGSQPPAILLMIFSQIIRRLDMLLDEFPALPRFELILSGDPRWGLTREELAHPDENGKVIEHLFEVHNVPNSHSSLFRYHVREHAPHRLQDARTVHCTMAPSEALLNYVRVEQGLRGTDLWQFKQQLRSDLKILLDRENPSTKEALWYLEQLLRLKGESFTTMTQTPLADIFELKGADRRNAALLASLVDAYNQQGISRKEVRILIFCIIKLETRIRMKYDVCLLRTMSRDSFTPVYKKQANALFHELTTNHNLTCVMLDDKDFGPEHEEQLDNSHVVLCCISMSYIRKLSDIAAPLRTRGITQNICRIAFEFAAAHRIDSGAMLGAVVDAAVLRNHSTAQLPGLSGMEVTDVSDLRRRAFGQNVGSLTDSILEQIFPYDKDPAKRRALIEAYPSSS